MKNQYQAYHKATHTVSKTRQVVMLYQGILRNLQQAKEAIVQKDIPERYNKLTRASEIVVGLQMSLDFNSGEEAAQALYDFYALLDSRIMQLHRTQSLEECDALIEEVRSMHDVWQGIDQGATIAAPPEKAVMPAEPTAPPAPQSDQQPTAPAPTSEQSITFSA